MADDDKVTASLNVDAGEREKDDFVLPVAPPAPRAATHLEASKQPVTNDAVRNLEVATPHVDHFPVSRAPLNVHGPKSCSAEAVEGYASKRQVSATEVGPGFHTIGGTKPGETRDFYFTRSEYIRMCWIPPGEFMMGSSREESCRDADENPHYVKLSKGFWMSKCPVTQEQWFQLMGERPSTFGRQGKLRTLLTGSEDHWRTLPVESVSWVDVCGNSHRTGGFLAKINASVPTRWRFDLPSEAEWEYACRAGTTTDFNNGGGLSRFSLVSSNLLKLGWYGDNSFDKTYPVGGKVPNAWGLHDMHGNVWEWCSDYYAEYPKVTTTDPSGLPIGDERVNRGGCWASSAKYCRSAFRSSDRPEHCSNRLGFRLVLRAELQRSERNGPR